MDATIIFIGSSCLVCLMPLAIYLLYLSYLNGRTSPTFISGPWDFGAVLLGLSGFLVLSGPLLVSLIDSTWRSYAFGGWAQLKGIGEREARAGSYLAIGYFLMLAGGIPLLIRMRRHMTAIYNVAAGAVEPALTHILDELGYPWRRVRGEIEVATKKVTDPASEQLFPHEAAAVRIDQFPTLGHVTLKWSGDWPAVRSEAESALARALAACGVARNPVASWMFTAAISIMIIMLLWLVVLVYIIMTPVK